LPSAGVKPPVVAGKNAGGNTSCRKNFPAAGGAVIPTSPHVCAAFCQIDILFPAHFFLTGSAPAGYLSTSDFRRQAAIILNKTYLRDDNATTGKASPGWKQRYYQTVAQPRVE
jgi:hypothetical protein